MKVSLNWLKDYVDINVDPKEYADKMTMSGTKVETVEYAGADVENVVIGKIEEILPHPDAEKLVITKVQVGREELVQIVTGASNISVGDIVPVALEGAKLPGGVKIKKGKLRGVDSFGMLCSSEELGIDFKYVDQRSKNGIYILSDEFVVGECALNQMGIKDSVIEFELTANRPDCRSLIGIAKETAATLGTELHIPSYETKNMVTGDIRATVQVEDKDLCPRFIIKQIQNVKVGPSPFWLQKRLISYGIRPINNIVDITNYVMVEYGQPLHAYDLNKLTTNEIVVRRAKEGEEITTLDDTIRKLDNQMLLITDGKNPIGIAGVMGGAGTQIDNETTDILLEAASFDADNIRLTSRRLGLRTDASSSFEKGIDVLRPFAAINRACLLITELGAGEVIDKVIDCGEATFEKTTIKSKFSTINRLMGTKLSSDEITKILESLLFEVECEGDQLEVIVPSERRDMTIEEDIIEEVARIYGYNNIPSSAIIAPVTQAVKSKERRFEDCVKELSRKNGLTEITTYSFVSPNGIQKAKLKEECHTKPLKLLNPLGEETSVMRTSLIPEMLEVATTNIARKNPEFAAFEYGNTFHSSAEGELPLEIKSLVAGVYGEKEDFFTVKSRLQGILQGIGIKNPTYVQQKDLETFHPGRCADVYYQKVKIGVIGEVHPLVREAFDVKKRMYLFELNIPKAMQLSDIQVHYIPIPKYPSIDKDIALVVDTSVEVGKLEDCILTHGKKLLESAKLFDIFEGAQVGENKKSVAFSLTFRAADRTLTDEETGKIIEKILQQLEREFGASLR